MRLYLDFETTSQVDIKELGHFAYVHHDTTEPTLLAYQYETDDEPSLLDFTQGDVLPDTLFDDVTEICAWNAAFDREVLHRFFGTPYACWIDAAVCAAANGFPRSLDGATGMKHKLTPKEKRMCMRTPVDEIEHGPTWDKFREYAKQDVRAMVDFMRMYGDVDLEDAWLDMRINDRGIPIDISSVKKALARLEEITPALLVEFKRITGGIAPTQVQAFREWLAASGCSLPDLREQTVLQTLNRTDLPEHVRRTLELRQMIGKTSLSKLTTMLDTAAVDGRVHGGIVTYGAITGRAAGRLIQPHNMKRPSMKHDEIMKVFDSGFVNADHKQIADCMRGFIALPDGRPISAVDFSNIEGRVLAWLAGEKWKLDAFRAFDRGEGEDIYLVTARRAGVEGQRQIGKTVELACGYQGALGAFMTMAALTGVDVPEAKANRLIADWRAAHQNTVDLWRALEDAALQALKMPDREIMVGQHLRMLRDETHLWMVLPSGRKLAYRSPRLCRNRIGRLALAYLCTEKTNYQTTYGGKLTENATQAVARDVLYDAMHRLEAAGLQIIMHVHDEVVIEGGEEERKLAEEIMRVPPEWAPDLPLAVEGWTGRRYRK